MRELERFYELSFRQFPGRTFDHYDIVFCADVNQVQIALGTLGMCRVGDKLAIHPPHAHGTDWPSKRETLG